MSNRYEIAVIPGDGIGREVVPEGIRVLEAVARRFGLAVAGQTTQTKAGVSPPERRELVERRPVCEPASLSPPVR